MTNTDLVFRFVNADRLGQTVRLPSSKCSIGAGENCTLQLAGRGMRPVHCFIVRGPGGTIVRRWSPDTRLNGRPFRDAALHVGDRLSVGPVELEVLEGASPDAAREASELQLQVQAQELELATLRDQLGQVQMQLDGQSERLAQANAHQQREAERFNQTIDTFAKLQTDWHIERDDLAARCAHLQSEVDAALARAEANNLARRAVTEMWSPDAPTNSSSEDNAELNAVRAELTAAQTQLATAQAELAAEASFLAERRAAFDMEVSQANATISARRTELDCAEAALLQQKNALEAETHHVQQMRTALTADRESLQKGHRLSQQRLDTYRGELADREALLNQRVADCERRETELVREREELQQTIEEIAAQRRQFEGESQRWEDDRRFFETQLAQQQEEVTVLQDELSNLRLAVESQQSFTNNSPSYDAASCTDAVVEQPSMEAEAEPELNVDEASTNLPTNATTPEKGMSEAMLTLQRLREAALRGDEEDDVPQACAEPVAAESRPAPQPPHRGEESDVSIEDYMAQLMQRVRGKSEEELPSPKRKPAVAVAKPASVEAPVSAAVQPTNLTQTEFPKSEAPCKPQEALRNLPARSTAPEQPRSLQAMRELANQSARSAIDSSVQRHWQTNVRGKFAVSIAAACSTGGLLWLGEGLFSWTTAAAAGSLVVAGLFAAAGYRLHRQGLPAGGEKSSS